MYFNIIYRPLKQSCIVTIQILCFLLLSNMGVKIYDYGFYTYHLLFTFVIYISTYYRHASLSPAHSATLRESIKQQSTTLIGWLEQTLRRHTKLLPVIFFLKF